MSYTVHEYNSVIINKSKQKTEEQLEINEYISSEVAVLCTACELLFCIPCTRSHSSTSVEAVPVGGMLLHV
jgi:hypothetical protein